MRAIADARWGTTLYEYDDLGQLIEAGFDEYLSKPVAIDQLVGALRRVSARAAG